MRQTQFFADTVLAIGRPPAASALADTVFADTVLAEAAAAETAEAAFSAEVAAWNAELQAQIAATHTA